MIPTQYVTYCLCYVVCNMSQRSAVPICQSPLLLLVLCMCYVSPDVGNNDVDVNYFTFRPMLGIIMMMMLSTTSRFMRFWE